MVEQSTVSNFLLGAVDNHAGVMWKNCGNPGLFYETKSMDIHKIYNSFIYHEAGQYAFFVSVSNNIDDVRTINEFASFGYRNAMGNKDLITGYKNQKIDNEWKLPSAIIPILNKKQFNLLKEKVQLYQVVYSPICSEPVNREHIQLDIPVLFVENEYLAWKEFFDYSKKAINVLKMKKGINNKIVKVKKNAGKLQLLLKEIEDELKKEVNGAIKNDGTLDKVTEYTRFLDKLTNSSNEDLFDIIGDFDMDISDIIEVLDDTKKKDFMKFHKALLSVLNDTKKNNTTEDKIIIQIEMREEFIQTSYNDLIKGNEKDVLKLENIWTDMNKKQGIQGGIVVLKRLSTTYKLFDDIESNIKTNGDKKMLTNLYTFAHHLINDDIRPYEGENEAIKFPKKKLYPTYKLEKFSEFLIDDIEDE